MRNCQGFVEVVKTPDSWKDLSFCLHTETVSTPHLSAHAILFYSFWALQFEVLFPVSSCPFTWNVHQHLFLAAVIKSLAPKQIDAQLFEGGDHILQLSPYVPCHTGWRWHVYDGELSVIVWADIWAQDT